MREIRNIEELNSLKASGKPMLLDFYADWCGPCQALLPTVEKLAEKHSDDIVIAKVNVDHNKDLAIEFGVRSIPALFFWDRGKIQEKLTGIQPESLLENKITHYIN